MKGVRVAIAVVRVCVFDFNIACVVSCTAVAATAGVRPHCVFACVLEYWCWKTVWVSYGQFGRGIEFFWLTLRHLPQLLRREHAGGQNNIIVHNAVVGIVCVYFVLPIFFFLIVICRTVIVINSVVWAAYEICKSKYKAVSQNISESCESSQVNKN